jgi:protein-L-isoaspartate(D-aspartate) O-methyltransferase
MTRSPAISDDKRAMLAAIVAETAETAALTGRDALSLRVLDAFARVRREAFVPAEEVAVAYVDAPLPIGHGQTISQPFIVAIMTELLDLTAEDVVLEIGTGSGYQAAILSLVARKVYGVEIVPELATAASRALLAERCRNVEIRCGDGALGWPEHAPYDAIIVTAAAEQLPPPLLAQLKPRGRLIAPIGPSFATQRLVLFRKDATGQIDERDIMGVAFVPLIAGTREG